MRIYLLLLFLTGCLFYSQAQTPADPPIENDSVYKSPDTFPEFPGGNAAFSTFISNHLIYPEEARKQLIKGMVIAQYIVEKDGSLSNIEIVKRYSLNASCDQALINALQQSPRWKPGIKDGKPVRVKQFARASFVY